MNIGTIREFDESIIEHTPFIQKVQLARSIPLSRRLVQLGRKFRRSSITSYLTRTPLSVNKFKQKKINIYTPCCRVSRSMSMQEM